jgi:hypothetical protein
MTVGGRVVGESSALWLNFAGGAEFANASSSSSTAGERDPPDMAEKEASRERLDIKKFDWEYYYVASDWENMKAAGTDEGLGQVI